jgi:hypothetical protein
MYRLETTTPVEVQQGSVETAQVASNRTTELPTALAVLNSDLSLQC